MKIAICSQNPNYFIKTVKSLFPQTEKFSSFGDSTDIVVRDGADVAFISFFNSSRIDKERYDKVIIDSNLQEK